MCKPTDMKAALETIWRLRQEKKDLISAWVAEGNALYTKITVLEALLAEKE